MLRRPGREALRAPNGQWQRRAGAAMVEMAVLLPIFVTVILGIIEFGRAMMVGQLVTNAARDGARMAISNNTTNQQVQTTISNFIQSSVGAAQANITVTITNSNPQSGNSLSNAKMGDLITVAVAIPFSTVSYIPPTYLAGASISASSTMRHE